MKWYVFLAVVQLGLVLAPTARADGDDLPSDARDEIDRFRREAARIGDGAGAKIAAKKADLLERLRALQTKYTKEGRLDEAVAIRDHVRQLEGYVPPIPVPDVHQRPTIRPVPKPVVVYRACQKVEVEWHGTWWAAEVVKMRGNQYFIHYTGWDCSWDEWVPECRIRICAPCVKPPPPCPPRRSELYPPLLLNGRPIAVAQGPRR